MAMRDRKSSGIAKVLYVRAWRRVSNQPAVKPQISFTSFTIIGASLIHFWGCMNAFNKVNLSGVVVTVGKICVRVFHHFCPGPVPLSAAHLPFLYLVGGHDGYRFISLLPALLLNPLPVGALLPNNKQIKLRFQKSLEQDLIEFYPLPWNSFNLGFLKLQMLSMDPCLCRWILPNLDP